MVEPLLLKEGEVELVRDEAMRDVLCERGMAFDGRQRPRSAAFVGHGKRLREAQREVRIVVEEKRSDVIVVDVEQHVRLLLLEPRAHGGKALEDRRPDRIVGRLRVDRVSDRRRVGRGESADYRGQIVSSGETLGCIIPSAIGRRVRGRRARARCAAAWPRPRRPAAARRGTRARQRSCPSSRSRTRPRKTRRIPRPRRTC